MEHEPLNKVTEYANAALQCVVEIANATTREVAQKWVAKAYEYAASCDALAVAAQDECTVINNYAQAASEATCAADAAERAIIALTIQTNQID